MARLLTFENNMQVLKNFTFGPKPPVLHGLGDAWFLLYGAGYLANASISLIQNAVWYFDFEVQVPLTITQIGVVVQTAGGTKARVGIYSTNNHRPYEKLLETSDLPTNSTGLKTYSCDFALEVGVKYWFGVASNGSPTVTANSDGNDRVPYYSHLGFAISGTTVNSIVGLRQNLSAGWTELPTQANPSSLVYNAYVPAIFVKVTL